MSPKFISHSQLHGHIIELLTVAFWGKMGSFDDPGKPSDTARSFTSTRSFVWFNFEIGCELSIRSRISGCFNRCLRILDVPPVFGIFFLHSDSLPSLSVTMHLHMLLAKSNVWTYGKYLDASIVNYLSTNYKFNISSLVCYCFETD